MLHSRLKKLVMYFSLLVFLSAHLDFLGLLHEILKKLLIMIRWRCFSLGWCFWDVCILLWRWPKHLRWLLWDVCILLWRWPKTSTSADFLYIFRTFASCCDTGPINYVDFSGTFASCCDADPNIYVDFSGTFASCCDADPNIKVDFSG